MTQEQELFGKLFNTIPLYNEDHLDVLLKTMDKESAVYLLIQAVKLAYHDGVYSMGETEVLSKAIRTLSKKEEIKEESK
jgi:hypothetical protein